MSKHELIKNDILEQMKKIKENKELAKLKEREEKINRRKIEKDNKRQLREEEKYINHQLKYINSKKESGKKQVNLFIENELIEKVDNYIVKQVSKNVIHNRSEVVALAIENFFQNLEEDTPNE